MPSKKAQTKTQSYQLESPGEGTYLISIFSRQFGLLESELMLSGLADRKMLTLPKGAFQIEIDEVGVNSTADGVFDITFGEEELVPLSSLIQEAKQSSGEASQKIGLYKRRRQSSTMSRASEAYDMPENTPTQRGFLGTPIGKTIPGMEGLSVRRSGTEAFVPEVERRVTNFTVGLSQRQVVMLMRRMHPMSRDGVRAKISGKDDRIEFLFEAEDVKASVYLDIAVQGRPLIRVPVPFFKSGVHVSMQAASGLKNIENADIAVTLGSPDLKIQNLINYLNETSVEQAQKYMTRMREDFGGDLIGYYLKANDIWAAILSATALTRTRLVHHEMESLEKLKNIAGFCPDVFIAYGWAIALQRAENHDEMEGQVFNALNRAYGAGLPAFLVSNSLALKFINGLADKGRSSSVKKKAHALRLNWRKRSVSRFLQGPFLITEGYNDTDGLLTEKTHLIVLKGSVAGGELSLTNDMTKS